MKEAATRSIQVKLILLAALLLAGASGAGEDAGEIVRRAIRNDEPNAADPALAFDLTERVRTQNLDDNMRVRSVLNRERTVHMTDFQTRRERYRKSIREIPEAFQFRLAGEEMVAGRAAFVIEATPKPGYRPVDRFSKVFTEVRGKLWIDKADYHWVKIEAELVDTVAFGWILVRLHGGSSATLTRQLVGENTWMPAGMWYKVSMRIGLVSFRAQETQTVYEDYRRSE